MANLKGTDQWFAIGDSNEIPLYEEPPEESTNRRLVVIAAAVSFVLLSVIGLGHAFRKTPVAAASAATPAYTPPAAIAQPSAPPPAAAPATAQGAASASDGSSLAAARAGNSAPRTHAKIAHKSAPRRIVKSKSK